MKTSAWLVLALVVFSLVVCGCTSGATDKSGAADTTAANGTAKDTEKEYDIKGKVVSVDADKKSVMLNHEDIVGLMKGMTMEFRVNDPKVLKGIEAGTEVAGRLRVSDGEYTITKLKKL